MTEPTIYFRSDEHFHHKNIIKYSNRPFETIEEMNEGLVERHNEIVTPDDVVIFGGDVSFRPYEECSYFLERMHGHKILLHGNHDHSSLKRAPIWEQSLHAIEIDHEGFRIIARHHPWKLSEMENDEENIIRLHGHTHGTFGKLHAGQIDISLEVWDYKPVSIDEIVALFTSRSVCNGW